MKKANGHKNGNTTGDKFFAPLSNTKPYFNKKIVAFVQGIKGEEKGANGNASGNSTQVVREAA